MSSPTQKKPLHDPLEGLAHLLEVPRPEPIPPTRGIYTNRNLRMDGVETVGFDMDYTLALYRKPHIEELAFRMTADSLVRKRGYPEVVLGLRYRSEFCMRGLVVDKKTGDLIKMDRYRHVGRAYHGRRALTKEERRARYRGPRIRLVPPRYHLIDTLFALPEIALFSEIVELKSADDEAYPTFEKIFDDIRSSIDEIHRDNSLKELVRGDLERFFLPDPELPLALHKLRSAGKRLFVLTNSLYDYTDEVMSHLLNGKLPDYPSWRSYFDIVIVGAEKPRFFTERKPFWLLDARGQPAEEARHKFDRLRVYQGGNLFDFERMAGVSNDHILYVGDHIYGDILRSKKSSAWRTAMVVEELEEEIAHVLRHDADFQRLRELGTKCRDLDGELNYLQAVQRALKSTQERGNLSPGDDAAVEMARRRNRALIDEGREELQKALHEQAELEEAVDRLANPYWGMLFREGSEPTRFSDQVQDYACIYTSRVSNFLFYTPNQYFRSQSDLMPHERR